MGQHTHSLYGAVCVCGVYDWIERDTVQESEEEDRDREKMRTLKKKKKKKWGLCAKKVPPFSPFPRVSSSVSSKGHTVKVTDINPTPQLIYGPDNSTSTHLLLLFLTSYLWSYIDYFTPHALWSAPLLLSGSICSFFTLPLCLAPSLTPRFTFSLGWLFIKQWELFH